MGKMNVRNDEEKRLIAHIKGKHPRNIGRRRDIIRAHRESKERHRRSWLENEDVRKDLSITKQTIFDEYFNAKAHKNLESTPDNSGKKDGIDCGWCTKFREIDCKICPNCGKPLNP
jgi:hypothetical protein